SFVSFSVFFSLTSFYFFFFFQAEDGIRDRTVTGVQTCALPISVIELGAPGVARVTGSVDVLVVAGIERELVRGHSNSIRSVLRRRWGLRHLRTRQRRYLPFAASVESAAWETAGADAASETSIDSAWPGTTREAREGASQERSKAIAFTTRH